MPQPPPTPPTYGKNGGSGAIWIVLLIGGGVIGLFCCGGVGLIGFFFARVQQSQEQVIRQELVARMDAQAARDQAQAAMDQMRAEQEAILDQAGDAMQDGMEPAETIVGEWVDSSTQAVYTIADVNGEPTLISAIDDNGEAFEVQESTWDGSTLRWRIRIPSSGYTLNEVASDVRANEINGTYTWVDANGGTGEGSSTWIRRSSRGVAEMIVGDWVDASMNATYTVSLVGGLPTVTSVIDDDYEVFEVLESNWDGAALRMRIRVPSSGYTLSATMLAIGEDQIQGTLVSIDPTDSSSPSNILVWNRKAQPAAD